MEAETGGLTESSNCSLLDWYLVHRKDLRQIHRKLLRIRWELAGALSTAQVSDRKGHYMVTKWALKEDLVLDSLKALCELVPEADATESGTGAWTSLEPLILQALEYAAKELSKRQSYSDLNKVSDFVVQLRDVVDTLGDAIDAVEEQLAEQVLETGT